MPWRLTTLCDQLSKSSRDPDFPSVEVTRLRVNERKGRGVCVERDLLKILGVCVSQSDVSDSLQPRGL